MRTKDILSRRATAVLDAPEDSRAAKTWAMPEPPRPRREMVEDFADDADTAAFLRAAGRNRRIRRSIIPQSKWGRIAAGAGTLLGVGVIAAGLWYSVRFFTHDARFRVPSSQAIAVTGNSHVTRSQMLSIFGEDVERNIFHIPLAQRKLDLERLPWVEHASVMRLLPNRVRVNVVERTPIAFVRQGGNIGMIDAGGVLLDIPPDAPGNPNYSFPVVTGISGTEPQSTRAPRMKIYQNFLRDLDSGGAKVTSNVSEVDLSDPEDVKALVVVNGSEVLVHFGQENFLDRYHRLQDHMAEWKQSYPRLSSVDLRYQGQAVLQMPQGSSAATAPVAPLVAEPNVDAPKASVPPPVATAPKASAPTADAKLSKSAAPAQKKPQTTKDKAAESAKKVAAIKDWMARREAVRKQQATAHGATGIPSAAASKPVQYHPSQVE